jgi:hypothetical protein
METKKKSLELIEQYIDYRSKTGRKQLTAAERGFILRNEIANKTNEELDDIIRIATEFSGGTLLGYGDRFDTWCAMHGRSRPGEELIKEMNRNPASAGIFVKKLIPTHAMLYRSYCSFISGRGRGRV